MAGNVLYTRKCCWKFCTIDNIKTSLVNWSWCTALSRWARLSIMNNRTGWWAHGVSSKMEKWKSVWLSGLANGIANIQPVSTVQAGVAKNGQAWQGHGRIWIEKGHLSCCWSPITWLVYREGKRTERGDGTKNLVKWQAGSLEPLVATDYTCNIVCSDCHHHVLLTHPSWVKSNISTKIKFHQRVELHHI